MNEVLDDDDQHVTIAGRTGKSEVLRTVMSDKQPEAVNLCAMETLMRDYLSVVLYRSTIKDGAEGVLHIWQGLASYSITSTLDAFGQPRFVLASEDGEPTRSVFSCWQEAADVLIAAIQEDSLAWM